MIRADDVVKVQNKVRATIVFSTFFILFHIGLTGFFMDRYSLWIGLWNLPAGIILFIMGYCFKNNRALLHSYRAGLDFCERNTVEQIEKGVVISPLLGRNDLKNEEIENDDSLKETSLFISPSSSTYST